ncbi:hypothetical protein F0U44_11225 [Nocardioides humilatus]|uniref:Cellulose biosynthesis cyclic di-GMP-binding regulatory protein BcsB n=1 Tax=Nocardioides humilatus TaxID=2607660 RepID=A0A5B1LHC6_9ACTN|nr:cellulose biosynthesis cyclic di-GMP-binding regulatory protein BcsB [Nocardioides humilatus]KAA1419027.1 hypothetical protein F0U44_11225 [Nocardioides humilatus]
MRNRLLTAAVVALLGVSATPLNQPAYADTTPVPGTLAAGVGATVELDVPVPAGLRPRRIDARLTIEAPDPSELAKVQIAAGGRLLASLPARPGPVSLRVRPSDVSAAGVIPLRMTLVPRPGTTSTNTGRCDDFPEGLATLDRIKLKVAGDEAAPETLAGFLSAGVRKVTIEVAPDADDALLGAALSTVTAVSSRYPADVDVNLIPDVADLVHTGTGARVIRLVSGTGETTTTIDRSRGVPTLTITGTPDGLTSAAAALTSANLGLADSGDTTGLAATPPATSEATRISFTDLAAGWAHLAGFGHSEQYVRVLQDSFGGPVDSLHVTVRGTHSVVPEGVNARFDTYVNGTLLDSQDLSGGDRLKVDVDVPAGLLTADNALVFALDADAPRGRCGEVTASPVEVHLDSAASAVTATHGAGPGGFVAFPQAFSGHVPVVFGGAADDHFTAARDAARLLTTLQRFAARPLTVEIASLEDVLEGDAPSAVLLYPTEEEADDADLPLEPGAERTLDPNGFTVEESSRLAVLEASQVDDGVRLLTLAAWDDDDRGPSAASRRLTEAVAEQPWSALAGSDVFVIAPHHDPAGFNSGAVGYPADLVSEQATDDSSSSPAESDDDSTTTTRQLVGGGIAVLFLLVVVWTGFRIARNRKLDAGK